MTGYEPLDNILKRTKDVLLYQETIMETLNKVFGFNLKTTNDLRKILSKKKKDQIKEWEPKIREAAKENGVPDDVAQYCWEIFLANADYSFCASHSYAYAALTAETVYLKFKYPQEFFLTCLKYVDNNPKPFEEIYHIKQELPDFGIELLPPDILVSDIDFKIEGKDIRYGLSSIKSISSKTFSKLRDFITAEKPDRFSVYQAGVNAGLNIRMMKALILVGSLSSVSNGASRNKMALECALWWLLKDKERQYCLKYGKDNNWDLVFMLKSLNDWEMDGKRVCRGTSRPDTVRKNIQTDYETYKINNKNQDLTNWKHERELLGYSYSCVLYDLYKEKNEEISPVSKVLEMLEGDNVALVGEILEMKEWMSKAGNPCAKMEINDGTGTILGMLFGDTLAAFKEHNKLPSKGDVVFLKGRRGDNELVWADKISSQEIKVVFQPADLKKWAKETHE